MRKQVGFQDRKKKIHQNFQEAKYDFKTNSAANQVNLNYLELSIKQWIKATDNIRFEIYLVSSI